MELGFGVDALLTVVFGAMAGGLTNAIAVWMLFHPYEPPRLLGRRVRWLHGAIPKNKPRLAGAIGRTVGKRLLTDDDLARAFSTPAFREAFDERLGAFLDALLDSRHGSLGQLLPATLAAELRSVLADAGDAALRRFDEYLGSDAFAETARRWAGELAARLREQPLADVLTPEREAALAEAARRWITETVEGERFAQAVDDSVDRAAARLLEPDRTFEGVVPAGLVAAVERGIAAYLPIAMERLGGLLEEPGARAHVERALHEILDRFMSDLKFHQRIFAALLIPPDAVDRILFAIEREGAGKIAELLRDEAVRDAMARRVNQGIVEFLRRPVRSVLGTPGEPSVEEGKRAVAGVLLSLARDPQTRGFLVEKMEATMQAAERRTWGDVFRHLPPERGADGIVSLARSDAMHRVYREGMDRFLEGVLTRPIGRPAGWLPGDAPARLRTALAEPLWAWLQDQVPIVVEKLDVARRVEQKVLEYPTPQLEALIRGVTQRELRLIVQLGYVLGGAIGLMLVVLNRALA